MALNDSFPLFLNLPTELRRKIWSIAFSDPVVVGFLSHPDNMGIHQVVTSPDHSLIAQTCKEAWQLMREAHHRVAFAITALDPSPVWIDFSKTTFYLDHGPFSRTCIAALGPVSAHVQNIALVWSTSRGLIETCKHLTGFLALRRVVILIAHGEDLADVRHFLDFGVDLMGCTDPPGAESLRLQVRQMGAPAIEVVTMTCT